MEKVRLSRREKFKGTSDRTAFGFGREKTYGFSWPQRNHRCNFCKKEFRSGQALGGHMNVHRRDRAKQIIQHTSPTWKISLTSSTNPSFQSTISAKLSPAAARFLPHTTSACHNSIYSPSAISSFQHDDYLVSPQIRDIRKKLGMEAYYVEVGEFKGFKKEENGSRVWKKREFFELDLNSMGSQTRDAKEDLDLELRLGCS